MQYSKAKQVKVEKTPDLNTLEGQKANAQEVDQGESAEQLLEQARPYVKLGGFTDYSGSPEATGKLADRIDAYFLLKTGK